MTRETTVDVSVGDHPTMGNVVRVYVKHGLDSCVITLTPVRARLLAKQLKALAAIAEAK